jgi:hypothetical protein
MTYVLDYTTIHESPEGASVTVYLKAYDGPRYIGNPTEGFPESVLYDRAKARGETEWSRADQLAELSVRFGTEVTAPVEELDGEDVPTEM